MKKKLHTYFMRIVFIILVMLTWGLFIKPQLVHAQTPLDAPTPKPTLTTLWKYQCIDTMKDSRDNARAWINNPDTDATIAAQMKTIKSLGATCVAIDTPYDAEFLPYLSKWVAAARVENLHIWFRGNFSGWEGWFNYPKITSTQDYFTKLDTFITTNPQLFRDGDIFTAAPEAENGGPFSPVNFPQYPAYRQFLIDEYTTEQKAFGAIKKNMTLNWFSMNGDMANQMYDQTTVDQTGDLITIDHYVRDPADMA
ncbi:MAG: hypothetical protein ACREHC_04555, partial [Candidatus Levyibacteriota bacterium]